jgi:hypothetical protein
MFTRGQSVRMDAQHLQYRSPAPSASAKRAAR